MDFCILKKIKREEINKKFDRLILIAYDGKSKYKQIIFLSSNLRI